MPQNKRSRGLTPQQENKPVALATDLAEKQLAEGTASAAVITHYLKLGSGERAPERERLRGQVDLLEAQIEQPRPTRPLESYTRRRSRLEVW